ncbi:hypothetical protein SDC9_18348 [bioreactor metagenome]|uniref:Uncharacterized protein n=1 Tax=bioreactor metagenome TaxID=1076179 RepID=A0A644U006_9ZZZZ|nr:hypothetical protein [Methanocorpusculum sp.]
MKGNADPGLSEVVSVALILTVLIITIAMTALIALPVMGTNADRVHNGDVLIEFCQMKADVDTVWLSSSANITRQAVFTLSPAADRTEITVFPNLLSAASFGRVTLTYGEQFVGDYAAVNLNYTSSNMYAEDIEISYDGGTLFQNGRILLPGSGIGSGRYVVVVNKTKVPEMSVAGAGVVTLNYRLEEITPYDSDHLCVFWMELR